MLSGAFFEALFEFSVVSYRVPAYRGPTCVDLVCGSTECRLAIVEFDDQGLCFNGQAMDDVQRELDGFEGRNPVIVVFAHGWKHNAVSDDLNLEHFKALLQNIEVNIATSRRPVFGVYLAWRGLSRTGNYLWKQSSFWDRKEAAARVASGAARELLGRLKAFRNGPPRAGCPPRATLIVVGHSLGGLVVYTALAQSLIEAAATRERAVPSFGDLVLLVNPAFSAISYLPIHELVARSSYNPNQFPVFISVTASNDDVTRVSYPIGCWSSLLTEAWRDAKEREALFRTMGHLDWLRTHELTGARAAPTSQGGPKGRADFRSLSGAGGMQENLRTVFGGVAVKRIPERKPSPFWVASASPDIIDGHNDIFNPIFVDFVQALVTATLVNEEDEF